MGSGLREVCLQDGVFGSLKLSIEKLFPKSPACLQRRLRRRHFLLHFLRHFLRHFLPTPFRSHPPQPNIDRDKDNAANKKTDLP